MIVLKNIKKMSKIPTAEEFVMRGHLWVGDDKDVDDLAKSHIEFAKLHVKAALKEASEKASTTYSEELLLGEVYNIDKDSILNAYPLENIK